MKPDEYEFWHNLPPVSSKKFLKYFLSHREGTSLYALGWISIVYLTLSLGLFKHYPELSILFMSLFVISVISIVIILCTIKIELKLYEIKKMLMLKGEEPKYGIYR